MPILIKLNCFFNINNWWADGFFSSLKGTVSWDFWPSVFFMNHLHLSPLTSILHSGNQRFLCCDLYSALKGWSSKNKLLAILYYPMSWRLTFKNLKIKKKFQFPRWSLHHETQKSDFGIEYLGNFEFIFKIAWAWRSEAQMELIHEKTKGKKSCDTVRLKKIFSFFLAYY